MIQRHELKSISPAEDMCKFMQGFGLALDYPSRQICSVYFDTPAFDAYRDGMEGLTPRSKFRYRWYGNKKVISSGLIEKKTTEDSYKTKQHWECEPDIKAITQKVSRLANKAFIPVCIISYRRHYFSNENGMRLTIDTSITGRGYNTFSTYLLKETVWEVKTTETKFAEVAALLGNSAIRYSKYDKVMSLLYPNLGRLS